MSTSTLTPKQRKRALKKEHRAIRPLKVAAKKLAAIVPGAGKLIPVKPHWGDNATSERRSTCPHKLVVHHLEREERNRLALYSTTVSCYEDRAHAEHSDGSRSWS